MTWQNLNALFEENYWLVQEQRKALKKDDKPKDEISLSELVNIPGVRSK